jgi:aryl-alcohol dehydrogenase-like predicted oxidoreductase
MAWSGHATPDGTAAYRERFKGQLAPEHFTFYQDLLASSIGMGTYLGHHDDATDHLYRDATLRAVELGCNVIDTAINYRFQRSERAIGEILKTLFESGKAKREEVIVATKGGFIPFDGEPPQNPADYFQKTFVEPGVASPSDLVAGCHCMTPEYLQHQLDASRENLGLECLDVYYIHNPETQLHEVSRDEFLRRMSSAFELLEMNVRQGAIRFYGTATWTAYREPQDAPDYVSISELVSLAQDLASDDHHFRAIQLPMNLAMPEALTQKNQRVDGVEMSPLEAARHLGLSVMASASIYQGNVAQGLPPTVGEVFNGLDTDAQRAIQFVRSSPGLSVALVGMKQVAHVEENLATARLAPAPLEQFLKLFQNP